MVIVQFRVCLVRPRRACVVDSLGLGITSYVTTMCTRYPDLVFVNFYAIPIFPF